LGDESLSQPRAADSHKKLDRKSDEKLVKKTDMKTDDNNQMGLF
jgi:hypothetical protein